MLGILGFFYCADQLSKLPPPPADLSVGKSLEYPAARWQVGQYGCAVLAGFGLLMTLFPKGR